MKNTVLSNLLFESRQSKSLLELHKRNNGLDDFCVGYILDYDDTFIIFQHVTKYGIEDGVHVEQISDLDRIEAHGAYLKACQALLATPEILPAQTTKQIAIPLNESWQFNLLNSGSYIGDLIAFELGGEGLFNFGFLIDLDEDHIVVHLVSEAGESQGTNLYRIIDISSFGFDTLQCRKRRAMYNLRLTGSI